MASLKMCVKCNKPIVKGQKGFKTEQGDTLHGDCYNCDQCGNNMLGKRVGSVPNDKGEFMKVCWDCMMKHPHYSMLFQGQDDKPKMVPQKNVKCKACNKQIIGKSHKTKLGDQYHPDCYTCERCKKSLMGVTYGYYKQQKWCNNCITQRSKGIGDITTEVKSDGSQAKAYMSNITKLREMDSGQLLGSSSGKERKCSKCGKKIAGPGIQVTKDNSELQYHRYCLDCDDCGKKVQATQIKIIKNKKLCRVCSGKYTSSY